LQEDIFRTTKRAIDTRICCVMKAVVLHLLCILMQTTYAYRSNDVHDQNIKE